MKHIPIVDVFAGPGGLSEGFTVFDDRKVKFEVRLSFEKDPIACSTLRLRSFFHQAHVTSARTSYYAYLRGEISADELRLRHSDLWHIAENNVVNLELGDPKFRLLVHRQIRNTVGGRRFVLIGGPPCQAYSVIGRSRRLGAGANPPDSNASRNRRRLETEFYRDPKHRLYREYLEIIAVHRPIVFVMENVKGLSSARTDSDSVKGQMFEVIRSDLECPAKALEASMPKEMVREFGELRPTKYRLFALTQNDLLFADEPRRASDFVVRSENYGVPQARHRIIVLGLRDDVSRLPNFLSPQSSVSARAVLQGLPPLRSGVSHNAHGWLSAIASELWRIPEPVQVDLRISKFMKTLRANAKHLTTGQRFISLAGQNTHAATQITTWLEDEHLGGVVQHESRSHMPSDLVRYLYCATFACKYGRSPSIEEWPAILRPNHRNVRTDRGRLRASGFSDRFKVQGVIDTHGAGRPSSTVTSHIAKDGHYYIHFDPTQCRSLTVREAARLQTFPDNYFFCGNRTQQYHQVGNAVPPLLAKQVAAVVADLL